MLEDVSMGNEVSLFDERSRWVKDLSDHESDGGTDEIGWNQNARCMALSVN